MIIFRGLILGNYGPGLVYDAWIFWAGLPIMPIIRIIGQVVK